LEAPVATRCFSHLMDAGLCQRSHVATLLVLGIGIGGFYARDCLSGVSTELLDHMKLSHTSYALVSTVVSVPTIVLSFVFGWLLDVYGIRRCTIAFTVTLACGVHTSAICGPADIWSITDGIGCALRWVCSGTFACV
jgi:MFS family permease